MSHMPLRQVHALPTPLSAIGLGAGGAWASAMVSDSHARSLIHRAIDLGVTYFDTGPSYGSGRAETRLATAIRRHPEVAVSTKVGTHLDDTGRPRKDYSKAAVRRSVEESLTRLMRDHIDILYIHGPLDVSEVTDELIDAMVDLRRQGITRSIGASCDGDVARRIIDTGAFDVLMTTVNVLAAEGLQIAGEAKRRGLTVVAKSPLAHATFSYSKLMPRSRRDIWYLARLLRHYPLDLARGLRIGPALDSSPRWSRTATSLRYILSLPEVDIAVVGTTQEHHLSELVAAACAGNLTLEEINRIRTAQRRILGAASPAS